MAETHAQFQARIRRERKARTAASRAALAAYWDQSATASIMADYAAGRFVNITIAADGTRTVTNGPGL